MERFRLIDPAGGEIGIVADEREAIDLGESVTMPDGREVEAVDVYDDDYGREGDVAATLVVDDGTA